MYSGAHGRKREDPLIKVFISSVTGGFSEFRDAAARACSRLLHEVVRAEDFGATYVTPEQACLAGVRQTDAMVLLLGQRYGEKQASGKSPTHEEYLEARDRQPVLVFVQEGVTPEPDQATFIAETRDWSTGHYTATFSTPEALDGEVTRALHELELATASGRTDPEELLARALARLPEAPRGFSAAARLCVSVAAGPRQQVLRPSELEDRSFADDVMQEAMFGEHRVLHPANATDVRVEGDRLIIAQKSASVEVDELGTVVVCCDWEREGDAYDSSLRALIEEDVEAQLDLILRFIASFLDKIDSVHRLTDVSPVALQTTSGFLGWKTRGEHAHDPNVVHGGAHGEPQPVHLSMIARPRAALSHDASKIARDLMVLIRREIRA